MFHKNFSAGNKVTLTPRMKRSVCNPEKYETGEVIRAGSYGVVDVLWNGLNKPIGMRSDELELEG